MQKREPEMSTPTARRRLQPRSGSKPHWRRISPGRFIGYRALTSGTGQWCARAYHGGRRGAAPGSYLETVLGSADDRTTADGETILSYQQALSAAMDWCEKQERIAKGLEPKPRGPYTLQQAIDDYLEWYEAQERANTWPRDVLYTHAVPVMGSVEVVRLTARQIRRWHLGVAKTPARLRTKPGAPQRYKALDGDAQRKRRESANKALTLLKAALNHAFEGGLVPTDREWKRVKAFRGTDAPRIRFLEVEEAGRLLNACEDDFRLLVRAALLTGARYGELVTMRVRDLNREVAAVRVSGKDGPRHIYLGDDGAAFLEALTKGRDGFDLMFSRSDGNPWGKNHQSRRIRTACEIAEIDPPISFHVLRHTYASHYLMNGGNLADLAEQLGHSDTRMTTRHYGHLADRWRAAQARRFAPSFGGLHYAEATG